MAKPVEKECERCGYVYNMMPSSRFCQQCRKMVRKELAATGFLSSIPSGTKKHTKSRIQREVDEDFSAAGFPSKEEERQFKGEWDAR